MARNFLVVMTNPVIGREEEFNDWYDNIHLPEIVRRDGMISAQRFKLSDIQVNADAPFKYMAMYELSAEGPTRDIEARKRAGPGSQTSSIDRTSRFGYYFTEHGGMVFSRVSPE
jgi:hypothetical protein